MAPETAAIVVLLAGGGALAAAGSLVRAFIRRPPAVRYATPPSDQALVAMVCLGLAGVLVGGVLVHVAAGGDRAGLGLTMSATCRDTAKYIDNVTGVVDLAAARALEDLGFPFEVVFERTPWAQAGVSYRWQMTDRHDMGRKYGGERLLRRYREHARYSVWADGIPGGLEGTAECIFVRDEETGKFWFWADGDGTWLLESDPGVRVYLDYNENLR